MSKGCVGSQRNPKTAVHNVANFQRKLENSSNAAAKRDGY